MKFPFYKDLAFRLFCLTRFFLAHFALISLIIEQFIFASSASAQALPINPDGSTNTQVTKTASGVDQINIAAPNSRGMSHNKFTDYNINKTGQVINNFSGKNASEIVAGSGATSVTRTQIGGLVAINSNLANSGSAKVILNEVTSVNPSKLMGYAEIAGGKADLIIANPNGISCAGCGFINTSRLSFIAGKSESNDKGDLGFKLTSPTLSIPLITVEGLGLDSSKTTSSDIIASSIKILGDIYGSEEGNLNIKSGDRNYDYQSNQVASFDSDLDQELFAIDASALAKIQAGRVFIVATKKGVGVNMASEVLANNEINIDAEGNVYYEKITSVNEVIISAKKDLKNISANSEIIAPKLNLKIGQNFENTALIIADKIDILGGENLQNFGEIHFNNLNLKSAKNFKNSGLIFAQNSIELEAQNFENLHSANFYALGEIKLKISDKISNQGNILAANNLSLSAQNLENSQLIKSEKNLKISLTNELKNYAEISADDSGEILAHNIFNSGNALILSENNLTLLAQSLYNSSSESSIASISSSLSINLEQNLFNQGLLFAATDLVIKPVSLTKNSLKVENEGEISALNKITLTANELNNFGKISAINNLEISALSSFKNEQDALVETQNNLIILASENFENSGLIYTQGNLNLRSKNFKNTSLGQIVAIDDINFAATLAQNYGLVSTDKNIQISKFGETENLETNFINNGEIIVAENFEMLFGKLENSGKINSNKILSLNLESLKNSGEIAANENLQVTAENISNSQLMSSGGNVIINSEILENFGQSALIIADANIKIRATQLSNSNTKVDSGFDIKSGLVAANGEISIQTDIFNNSSGVVFARNTDLKFLNFSQMNLSNSLGKFISTDSLVLNLGNLDHTITGELVAKNIDITANNITNQGKVTSYDFIKLNATGLSGVLGSGNIVNGFADGDNSNVVLEAKSYVDFNAKNNILNYGTISAESDLTLNAEASINNYGLIWGGFGTTKINTKNGSFTNALNTSELNAANNLEFNLGDDLNNYGAIASANDLISNVKDGLYNYKSAMIWSGSNATFNVANNFINREADIYAENNLTIQKNNSEDAANNKTNSLQNISGNISAYFGDLSIKANNIVNTRTSFAKQNSKKTIYKYKIDGTLWHDLVEYSYSGVNGNESIIFAGGNSDIQSSSLNNDGSSILALNNLNLKTNSLLNNSRYVYSGTREHYVGKYIYYGSGAGWRYYGSGKWNLNSEKYIYKSQLYANANIKAGGNISGSIAKQINNTTIAQGAAVGRGEAKNNALQVNKIDVYSLAKNGVVNIDLSAISQALSSNQNSANQKLQKSESLNQGMSNISEQDVKNQKRDTAFLGNFKINLKPSKNQPLVEGRSQFIDVSKFFGSKYYFDQLGLNGENILDNLNHQTRQNIPTSFLGDAFVENQLIANQLQSLSNNSILLPNNSSDIDKQIKALLDNSISEMNRLGIDAKDLLLNGLSESQSKALTKDIITFEKTDLNGISVIAPKIYLSLDSRKKLFGLNDDGSSSPALAMGSTISAGGTLNIIAPDAILNSNGAIISGGDMSLNIGQINTTSKAFLSDGSLAKLSIKKSSSSLSNLDNVGNSLIKSGGDLRIKASNINLQNTLLSSNGKAALAATKNITLANDIDFSATLANSSLSKANSKVVSLNNAETSGNFAILSTSLVLDEAETARSNIAFNSVSDIEITSSGSVDIANNYFNTGGSIFIEAGGNINNSNFTVKASENVVMEANNINNIHTNNNSNETRIEAGAVVSLNAVKDLDGNGGNINNIGATIKGGDLVYLTAENNINNKALVEYVIKNKETTYSSGLSGSETATNFSNSSLNNEGISANDTNILSSKSSKIRSNLIAQGNIESEGDVVIVAGNNINNVGSNISAANSAYIEATDGNINVTTASLRDRTVTKWGKRKKGGMSISDKTTNLESTIVASSGSLELKAIDANLGSSLSSDSGNVNVKGSFLSAAEDLIISATDDVNITSAQDTSYKETKTWKKGSFGSSKSSSRKVTSTTQVGSELATTNNGDINISAGVDNLSSVGESNSLGNINIIASKLITQDSDNDSSNNISDGDINLVARNNANIVSDLNTNYSESFSTKKGSTIAKSSVNIKSNLTNIKSEVSSVGDVKIESGNDVNLVGAKIFGDNATIEAGAEVNIYGVKDESYSYSKTTKARNFSNVLPGVSNFLEVTAKFYEVFPIPVLGEIAQFENSLVNGDFSSKSNLLEKKNITNQGSIIDVTGNLTVLANKDLNIVGSSLNGDSASIKSTTGDINIYNTVDLDYERSESSKSKTTFSSVGASVVQTAAAAISSGIATLSAISTPAQKKHKVEENQEAAKNVPQKSEQKININSDETLIASQLNFNSIAIEAGNNTNITSSDLSANNSIAISSGGSTNITTAVENDYSYSQTIKKSPSIGAALSNSIVKIVNDVLPSFGRSKSDNTSSNNDISELVYDQNKQKVETTSKTNVASNIEAGEDVVITSQENNLISGSNLIAGDSIELTSVNGTTTITSAQDTTSTSTETVTQNYNDISGNYNRGRTSVDSNSRVEEVKTTKDSTIQKQSLLQSENALRIMSNKDLNILSSDLVSNNGEIELNSSEGNVNILSLSNTTTTSSEIKTGTQTLSAGVGNTALDAAYAEYDVIQAAKMVADAKKNLNHMETLEKDGRASKDAVEDAEINLMIATLNLALAELKLAVAAAKVAGSAQTLGFYADLQLSISGSKTNINTTSSEAVASNINSKGNLIISSGMSLLDSDTDLMAGVVGNTTITGANVSSSDSDITIASKNNTTIDASKDTYASSTRSSSWSESLTLGSTVVGGSQLDAMVQAAQIALNVAMNKSKSDTSSTTYNNSQLSAKSGNISITSNGTIVSGSQEGGDTIISGANLLAKDITLNTQGNLTVESKQNSYTDKSKSFGISLGGGSSSANFGVNYGSSKTDRLWVDDQTTVIGTNSIIINTDNNTDIKGALIANITNYDSVILSGSEGSQEFIDGNNLILNTKTLTFTNLQDHYITENFGAGFSTSVGTGMKGDSSNQIQNLNFYPSGSTTLSLQNGSTKKEQTTKATLGNGMINLNGTTLTLSDIAANSDLKDLNRDVNNSQIVTLDQITGALDVSVTLDNRIFTEKGRSEIKKEQENLGENLKATTNMQAKLIDTPLVSAATSNIPGLSYAASWVAGEGGSFATLATQLFGLNYLLDSGNTRFQTNKIENLDNETLAKAVQGKDGFSLQQKSGYETEDGQKVNFFIITDKEGNSQTFRYVSDFKNLNDITISDLLNTKDYSLHGIDNTSDEAFLKGIMQLGTITNHTTNAENNTSSSNFVTLNAPTKGLLNDGLENLYNTIFGKTPIASANIIQLQDFSQTLGAVAGYQSITTQTGTNSFQTNPINISNVRMVGHSNGGDRLYLGVLRGAEGGALSSMKNLQVQFYGVPSLTQNIIDAATNAGLKTDKTPIQHVINASDPVPNLLGRNAGLNPVTIGNSLLAVPTLGSTTLSPHSNYYCQGSICNFDKVNNVTSSQ